MTIRREEAVHRAIRTGERAVRGHPYEADQEVICFDFVNSVLARWV